MDGDFFEIIFKFIFGDMKDKIRIIVEIIIVLAFLMGLYYVCAVEERKILGGILIAVSIVITIVLTIKRFF